MPLLEDLPLQSFKGLEKESLRITTSGKIARTPHPHRLGSPLTHPFITTDYSEALIELITPPVASPQTPLPFLEALHRFVYQALPAEELLLATSMPIGFEREEEIPIASYGSSHLGRLKHLYRVGLSYRYGRAMQTIAGIHFNFSLSKEALSLLHRERGREREAEAFRSELYLGQIRNLYRFGWLILYLFGASPVVDAAFLRCRRIPTKELLPLDEETFYAPFATSLRMSEIGYFSPVQRGIPVDWNRLEGYITALLQATRTPYPPYQEIGLHGGGRPLQLNANLLQIENEFYSPFRPKPLPGPGRLLCRLARQGIGYIEIRALDLNPFLPLGIDEKGISFLELLALDALLRPSPPFTPEEKQRVEENLLRTAWQGRHPELRLWKGEERVALQSWAEELLEGMLPLAEALDRQFFTRAYRESLAHFYRLVRDPSATPSARIVAELKARKIPFRQWARELSEQHAAYFRKGELPQEERRLLEQETERSFERQRLLEEESRKLPFETFLARYLEDPCGEVRDGERSAQRTEPSA